MKCFLFALQGIWAALRSEKNLQIHLFFTLGALFFAFFLGCSRTEWVFILVCIGSVWSAELFNTAIEKICDLLHPDPHPKIKFIKDVSAGAVLVLAFTAFCVGLIIFLPKFLELYHF